MSLPRSSFYPLLALALGLTTSASAQAQPAQPASRKEPTQTVSVDAYDALDRQVHQAIEISRRRFLSGDAHTPWQILHGLIAFRNEFEIKVGDQKTNAMRWISNNPKFRGEAWFSRTPYGGAAHSFTQPYIFEGHPCQFLAILTMSNLPPDHQFMTDQGPITITDMVKHAQAVVNTQEEITWVLWALAKYIPHDATWVNRQNQPWSMERLVQIQTRANVWDGACGGTHGLFALTRARENYLSSGKPLQGVWLEADYKIKRYIQTAKSLQNPDGSLSANYFRGKQYSRDFNRRIETSGHQLEFLAESMSDEELRQEWMRNAIAALSRDLIENAKEPLKVGPLYHAVDALVIYRDRTRKVEPTPSPEQTPETAVAPQQVSPDGPPALTLPEMKPAPVKNAAGPAPLQVEAAKPIEAAMPVEAPQSKEVAGPTEPVVTQPAPDFTREIEALKLADTAAVEAEEAARLAETAAVKAETEAKQRSEEARKLRELAKVRREEATAKRSLSEAMQTELNNRRSVYEKTQKNPVEAKPVSRTRELPGGLLNQSLPDSTK